jgi:hypothetical protein
MNYVKTDCFGGPPLPQEYLIYLFLVLAVWSFAWKVLHPPKPPCWSLSGRTRRRV